MFKISDIRREYKSKQLCRSTLTSNPIHLFSKWLNEAFLKKISDPNAMCLSTVDQFGQPWQRMVLLKYFNNKNMIFFTNLKSRKSFHINNNPKVSLCFPWNTMDRQVTVIGYANKISKKEVFKFFYKRPKNYQISTWSSHQSSIISSRKILENRFLKIKKRYFFKKIPFPKFWGGYKIKINSIEFWQGRVCRLHDRFIYIRNNNKWNINRLSP